MIKMFMRSSSVNAARSGSLACANAPEAGPIVTKVRIRSRLAYFIGPCTEITAGGGRQR